MEQVSYSELRASLASVMDNIAKNRVTYKITRKNKDNMVMISEDDYLSMQETLHLLSNPVNASHLAKSLQEADNKEFVEVEL